MDSSQTGAGSASLEGYEYQIDVSIWIALDLVLGLRVTTELQLEPPSQEDAEADLSVATTVAIKSYRLVVQAKLRSGDAWTVKGLESLLAHGKARRSVKDRLQDPKVRYLLVTSAGLNGGARNLSVPKPANWPPDGLEMPKTLVKLLGAAAKGRVAVIGSLDPERLESLIKQSLVDKFRVPTAQLPACLKTLRDETRLRIRGGGSGRWRVEELESVIRTHDGYVASSKDLDQYVKPTNWAELRRLLDERHAAIIVGQSGTGKTMATKQLYAELRDSIPGLNRIAITKGPHQIEENAYLSPVLFDIEDPWGRFDFEPAKRPWNDQLSQHFAKASATRLFIATSRRDVAQSSGALNTVSPWIFELEAEHYGKKQRVRLYRARIEQLPRRLQDLAINAEHEVLLNLSTPLEIQKFFDALLTMDPAEVARSAARSRSQAIGKAHELSIERTVIDQIGQRNDVRAAAVIWGLLRGSDRISLQYLRQLEAEMADSGPAVDIDVQGLVGFFVAARNLRQSDDLVSYYHPRVEAGIEAAMRSNALPVRSALRGLIHALITRDSAGMSWGASVAATIIMASKSRFPNVVLTINAEVQTAIDEWISATLLEDSHDFEGTLHIAAAAGSTACNAAEIARFITAREVRRIGFSLSRWVSTPHDKKWYARMVADPSVGALLTRFLTTVLPSQRDDFDNDFADEVIRLYPDARSAFVKAALKVVHLGVVHTDDVIAYGALLDIESFEPVIDEAVKELTLSPETLEDARQLRLDLVNEVYSEDYGDHLSENEEGYTAGEFIKAYVRRARTLGDWKRIERHQYLDFLLDDWLRALVADQKPKPAEIAAAFAKSVGGGSERKMWGVLLEIWDDRYLEPALDRVVDGDLDCETELMAVFCIMRHAQSRLAEVVDRLVEADRLDRLIEIGIGLAEHKGDSYYAKRGLSADIFDRAVNLLPPEVAEISRAAFGLRKKQNVTLSIDALEFLSRVNGQGWEVTKLRLELDQQFKTATEADVRRTLTDSDDSSVAVLAIGAAIRHGMRDEVHQAIDHRFAHVVALALAEIAKPTPAPLPDRLVALRKSRGSPVRAALVAQLDEKPHPDHLPALLDLASDHWSKREHAGSDPSFPIAEAAVKAIAKCGRPSVDAQEKLFGIASESRDPDLRQLIFNFLAESYGSTYQERLFDQATDRIAGRHRVASARALIHAADSIAPEIVSKISDELLRCAVEPVAALLCLLLAWRADVDRVIAAANALSTNRKRRVFIVLLLSFLAERDEKSASLVAKLLPADHLAVRWALGEPLADVRKDLLDDLGDVLCTREVMPYIKSASSG